MKVMAAAHEVPRAQAQFSSFDYEALHRGTWKRPGNAHPRMRARGWADPGERVALKYVSVEVRCRPILDIGVGAGRTTDLLRPISRDYTGIDESLRMVEMCRARHPDAQISRMEPRNLGRFDDDQFALVVFSLNGIDAVSRSDRRRILREVARVLQPNGLFVFSAHNRDAARRAELPTFAPASHPISVWPAPRGWQLVRSLFGSMRHYLPQTAPAQAEAQDTGALHCDASAFATLGAYASMAEQKRQLREAGLHTELVLDPIAGRPVAEGAQAGAFAWFHYVARKV